MFVNRVECGCEWKRHGWQGIILLVILFYFIYDIVKLKQQKELKFVKKVKI